MQADINEMIIYAERYAIARRSYASTEMADLIKRYAETDGMLTRKTRTVLVRDIKQAFKEGDIYYDDQKRDWNIALKALTESLELGL